MSKSLRERTVKQFLYLDEYNHNYLHNSTDFQIIDSKNHYNNERYILFHLILFYNNSLPRTDWCQTSRHQIVSPRLSALSTPLFHAATLQRRSISRTHTHKASRTTTGIDISVVS